MTVAPEAPSTKYREHPSRTLRKRDNVSNMTLEITLWKRMLLVFGAYVTAATLEMGIDCYLFQNHVCISLDRGGVFDWVQQYVTQVWLFQVGLMTVFPFLDRLGLAATTAIYLCLGGLAILARRRIVFLRIFAVLVVVLIANIGGCIKGYSDAHRHRQQAEGKHGIEPSASRSHLQRSAGSRSVSIVAGAAEQHVVCKKLIRRLNEIRTC